MLPIILFDVSDADDILLNPAITWQPDKTFTSDRLAAVRRGKTGWPRLTGPVPNFSKGLPALVTFGGIVPDPFFRIAVWAAVFIVGGRGERGRGSAVITVCEGPGRRSPDFADSEDLTYVILICKRIWRQQIEVMVEISKLADGAKFGILSREIIE